MKQLSAVTLIVLSLMTAGCSEDEAAKAAPPRSTPVTTLTVSSRAVEVIETTTGYIETKAAPVVAAEVAGQVLRIETDIGAHVATDQLLATIDPTDYENQLRSRTGEVDRIQTLIDNQRRRVARLRSLLDDNFVSDNALEDEEAALKALQRQLTTAQALADIAARELQKCEIRAPVGGQIQSRHIDVGDYVRKGDAAFQISDASQLRAHLPFPETVIRQLQPGQDVRLDTPASATGTVTGSITELRPMVEPTSRAGEAMVDVENPGDWLPGSSVNGSVVLAIRESIVIPTLALVLRPAGRVVYVIDGDRAQQRLVTIGEYLSGEVEIIAGLETGETIAVDGAAYLSEGALVKGTPLASTAE